MRQCVGAPKTQASVARRRARAHPHGGRQRQAGHGARSRRGRAHPHVGRSAAADPRRRASKKGDPLADRAAGRHHGGQADVGADSVVPSAAALARRRPADAARRRLSIEARVRTTGPTGVEMEALTAVAVAALTVYDMVKAVDKAMVIGEIRLARRRPAAAAAPGAGSDERSRRHLQPVRSWCIPEANVEWLRAQFPDHTFVRRRHRRRDACAPSPTSTSRSARRSPPVTLAAARTPALDPQPRGRRGQHALSGDGRQRQS